MTKTGTVRAAVFLGDLFVGQVQANEIPTQSYVSNA
jgi:hypothetical protein